MRHASAPPYTRENIAPAKPCRVSANLAPKSVRRSTGLATSVTRSDRFSLDDHFPIRTPGRRILEGFWDVKGKFLSSCGSGNVRIGSTFSGLIGKLSYRSEERRVGKEWSHRW